MSIYPVYLSGVDPAVLQRFGHRPEGAVSLRVGGCHMTSVAGEAIPQNLGIYLCPPLPRAFPFLPHQKSRSFPQRKAFARQIKRTAKISIPRAQGIEPAEGYFR